MVPAYKEGAELLTFTLRVYFVADTGRNTATGDPVYGLYVKGLDGSPQEILEGVENFQLLYGEKLDSGNIRYVTADNVLNMGDVVGVRVGVLVQGYDQVLGEDDDRSYNLPGASISDAGLGAHLGDRALRRPFTITAKLRNRR